MAKLRAAPITLEDLQEYLASESDFGFEMQVLRELRAKHLKFEHSGHYEDPVTRKLREFDIRALYQAGPYRVRLAIECKNLRANAPLLVSMVSRDLEEAYHQFVQMPSLSDDHLSELARTQVIPIQNSRFYPSNDRVVKSTVQVGRTSEGAFSANDSDVYEKWGQALASAADLVDRTTLVEIGNANGDSPYPLFATVLPCLVVPDGRLWGVDYDMNGVQMGLPRELKRASQFVGKSYELRARSRLSLVLSHLEIVTFSGLFELLDLIRSDPTLLFPDEGHRKAIQAADL